MLKELDVDEEQVVPVDQVVLDVPANVVVLKTRLELLLQKPRSGGAKYPSLPFTGEISYRCFKGCQKVFWRPQKSAYEIFPVKLHLCDFGPSETS